MTIKCTAYREDTEPHRLDRLKDLAGQIAAKNIRNVIALHDHKGTLYVNFNQRPTTFQIVSVGQAWTTMKEINMNVYADGAPICWDAGGYNPFGGPST